MEWPVWLEAWDRATFLEVHRGLHGLRSPGLDAYLRWVNELGNGWALIAVVALWVALRPSVRAAVRGLAQVGLAFGATSLATRLLKDAFDHPRPQRVFAGRFAEGDLVAAFGETVRNHSFPSGHAATSFALALVVVAWASGIPSGPRRWFVRALAVLLACSTGVARVYAGAHFPTDVIGGALEGLACAALALAAVRAVAGRRLPDGPRPPPGPPAYA